MPPSRRPKRSEEPEHQFVRERFLRSVNLIFDAESPESIVHYRPTAKGTRLLNALLAREAERAFMIVAPYGSGKSLASEYALHIIENRPESSAVLRSLGQRLTAVDAELGAIAEDRRRGKKQGLVLALHANVAALPQALKAAALDSLTRMGQQRLRRAVASQACDDMRSAARFLSTLSDKASEEGLDRVAIIWDEFGRHLEHLVASGRTAELVDLQALAEYASRAEKIPLVLAVLLHQGFLHYASSAPDLVRREWRKVQGRFQSLEYVDDSRELYRLLADLIHDNAKVQVPPKAAFVAFASKAVDIELMKDFSRSELAEVLRRAYPLSPAAFYLLPRISARVAQNERTLFSFLYSVPLDRPVTPDQLYDYFTPEMRSDTAAGGCYHQWLVTESALAKLADGPEAVMTLKTACLLGMGITGQRARVGLEHLELAIGALGVVRRPRAVTRLLIKRGLLLYRKHNNDVSVWHGTDIDLRGKLEEKKQALRGAFELLPFLEKEAPPPIWRPVEYNDRFRIRRFFAGGYATFGPKGDIVHSNGGNDPAVARADGRIVYMFAETRESLATAEAAAPAYSKKAGALVLVAMPREPLPLTECALELKCLVDMQDSPQLTSADPLVLPELKQMADDTRGYLQRLLDRLVLPGRRGPSWFHNGEQVHIESPRQLRSFLSGIARQTYRSTPVINNEMIVRQRLTSSQVNSRKKTTLAILERSGQESLGLDGNTPDVSIFRTVLLNTGLYRQDSRTGAWRYAEPREVTDPGLRRVWDILRDFFTSTSKPPKSFTDLFAKLGGPPFGMRDGLYPVLLAAAYRAFPAAQSLTYRGEYVGDILASNIESICSDPGSYELSVVALTPNQTRYLTGVFEYFGAALDYTVKEQDLLRMCYEALQAWKHKLPPAAAASRDLSDRTQELRKLLLGTAEPVRLFLRDVPTLLDTPVDEPDKLVAVFTSLASELTRVVAGFRTQASAAVRRVFSFVNGTGSAQLQDLLATWSGCFPEPFVMALEDKVAAGLLAAGNRVYESEDRLLDDLASLILQRAVKDWDEHTPWQFGRGLAQVVLQVEDDALRYVGASEVTSKEASSLRRLVQGRLGENYARLAKLGGPAAARRTIRALLESKDE